MHTRGSQSRGASHLSPEENTRSMQLEIDHLCYAMSDVGEPLRVLTPLLTMIVIIVIAPNPGLLLVSPFHVIRIIIIGKERKVCLARVWAMTLWVGL